MSNKLKRKAKPYKAPLNVSNFAVQQISNITGAKVESLKFWCAAREKEYEEFYTKESQKKLWKAEDYIAVANVLISLIAIKMSWGFTKSCAKFIKNLNPAKEYIERNGVENTYLELKKLMEIDIAFDSMDINKEFGFDGGIEMAKDNYIFLTTGDMSNISVDLIKNALMEYESTGYTPDQIKDMKFLLIEKSKECGKLRREIQNIQNDLEAEE